MTETDECRLITEVAIEQAMESCGSEEAVREQLRRIVGLEGEEEDPNCNVALDEGLNEETLQSTKGTRQWVMCRAWELVQDNDMTLSSATSRAWNEAKARGDELGVEV